MTKKVYTIKVDDENLKNTAKSKSVETKKKASEEAVETFGILEINNASSKSKVRKTADAGFVKNETGCAKKNVKSKVSEVEDYFDFSFRPQTKTAEVKVEAKAEVKKAPAKKAATKTVAKKEVKSKTTKTAKAEAKTSSASTLKMPATEEKSERTKVVVAEVCDRICFDDDAEKIMSVARLGALFG